MTTVLFVLAEDFCCFFFSLSIYWINIKLELRNIKFSGRKDKKRFKSKYYQMITTIYNLANVILIKIEQPDEMGELLL